MGKHTMNMRVTDTSPDMLVYGSALLAVVKKHGHLDLQSLVIGLALATGAVASTLEGQAAWEDVRLLIAENVKMARDRALGESGGPAMCAPGSQQRH